MPLWFHIVGVILLELAIIGIPSMLFGMSMAQGNRNEQILIGSLVVVGALLSPFAYAIMMA